MARVVYKVRPDWILARLTAEEAGNAGCSMKAMIKGHVPFDIIFNEQMEDLSRYRALVLVGQNNLSDEHVGGIKNFVLSGGGLVVTGLTSQFDKWGRRRSEPALSDLLEIDGFWVPGHLAGRSLADEIKVAQDGHVWSICLRSCFLMVIKRPSGRVTGTAIWSGGPGSNLATGEN